MNSIEGRFNDLENFIKENSERQASFSGVPYYIFLYDPSEERKILNEVDRLEHRLVRAGNVVRKISFASILFEILQQKGYLDRSFQLEVEDHESLKRVIGSILKKELIQYFGKLEKVSKGIILITRTGSLYPFMKVSSLLIEIEGLIKSPLVIFYPGKRENKALYFLNEFEDHYYKATII